MIRVLATRHRWHEAWQSRQCSCQRFWSALQTVSYAVDAAATPCVPVVIVGAGPTGLVLSSLLSQYGIQHMLLEKGCGLTQHPQAHYINNRTMEVFRGIPGLSQQVAALSPPLAEWRRFIYCESMVEGQLLGEVDHFPGQSAACDPSVSPEPVAHLSQHRLVQLLHDTAQQLAKAAVGSSSSSILFNREVTSVSLVSFPHQLPPHHKTQLHQHQQPLEHPPQQQSQQQQPQQPQQQQQQQQQHAAASGQGGVLSGDEAAQQYPVCVALLDSSQGRPQQQLVRCSYLVAADGSHSIIRRLLGIQMQGEAGMQHLISIHFSWPQLGHALLQCGREGMLYFVFNSQVVAVLVAHNLQAGEFVAQVPYFPPLQSAAQFTHALCSELIQAAAGFTPQQQQLQHTSAPYPPGPAADAAAAAAAAGQLGAGGLQVHSIKQWVMSAEVAEEYGSWGNRLLLAGDAAHRFPPAGGFGMNTGIQDAHNLAWKLAAVLTDCADPTLLSTYQPERLPVAQANAALSVNNWREAIRVPQALGLDPAAAGLVNKVVSSAPLPAPVASWLLDAALTAGRGLANAVIPLRRGALQDILASGMSLRLQFPREDLGFVYSSGAVDAGSEQQQGRQQVQAGSSDKSSSSSRRRGNVYQPAIVVGGRLPHCWLQMVGPGGATNKVSTLDLCTADNLGLNMLLICTGTSSRSSGSGDGSAEDVASSGSGGSSDWVAAGLQLQAQGWPLRVLQVLPAGAELGDAAASAVTPADASQQASCAVDVDGVWAQLLAEDAGSAAVLVRPDGHIAWCSPVGSPGASSGDHSGQQSTLERLLRHVLCLLQPSD